MAKVMGLITANYMDRLAGITENRSLASLPFGGRYRLIDFALSNMTNSGITTVSLITPATYRSIIDHVGAGKQWSLDRKVGGLLILPGSVMGMKKSESGKFIMRDLIQNKVVLERSQTDLVLMMSSDKIMNFNFSDAIKEHEENGRNITMFYKTIDNADDVSGQYLDVDRDGRVKGINSSAYGKSKKFMDCLIIDRKLLMNFLEWYNLMEHSDLMDVIEDNLSKLDVKTYELKTYVATIETMADYIRSSRDLFDEDINSQLFNGKDKIFTKVVDTPPSRYRDSANVTNSIIPTGCEIEGKVENSVLFRGVKVRKGAVVKNCILFQRCDVGENVVLDEVICDKGVSISAGTRLYGTAGRPCIMTKSMY